MAKPLEKNFDTCPMLARSDWGVGHIQQRGLGHALSAGQSPVGFHGPRVGGWLVFLNGCHRGEDMRLPVGETKLGSSWLSDVVLTGIGIGSQHALIQMGVGGAMIAPLAGDRTVKLNNVQIADAQTLEDGCLVSIGELHCVYRSADQMSRGYRPKDTPRPLHMPAQSSHRENLCGWLVITKGAMLGQDFRLINGRVRIGSEPGLEVTIADPNLAKDALTLSVSGKEGQVSSIGESSKLLVNGVESGVNSILKESDTVVIDQVEGYIKWFLS